MAKLKELAKFNSYVGVSQIMWTTQLESDKLQLNLKSYVSENLDISMISFEFQTQRAMSLKLIYGQLKTYLNSGKLEPWTS